MYISVKIEEKKKAKEAREKAIESQNKQALALKMQVIFANFFETALSKIPSHLAFYGVVNANMLSVKYDANSNSGSVFLPCNMANAPSYFNTFKTHLINICKSIRLNAINTLQNQVQADRYQYQVDYVNSMHIGIWQGKEFSEYLKDYILLYQSCLDELFDVKITNIKSKSGGINIDFTANFDDGGMSPDFYHL